MAVVYHGPNIGTVFSVYQNTVKRTRYFGGNPHKTRTNATTGQFVVGRMYVDVGSASHYASVKADELLFWQKQLTTSEIDNVYKMYG